MVVHIPNVNVDVNVSDKVLINNAEYLAENISHSHSSIIVQLTLTDVVKKLDVLINSNAEILQINHIDTILLKTHILEYVSMFIGYTSILLDSYDLYNKDYKVLTNKYGDVDKDLLNKVNNEMLIEADKIITNILKTFNINIDIVDDDDFNSFIVMLNDFFIYVSILHNDYKYVEYMHIIFKDLGIDTKTIDTILPQSFKVIKNKYGTDVFIQNILIIYTKGVLCLR